MSFKAAINRGLKKPHISLPHKRYGLKVYKSGHLGQDYNNEMAVQFCYEQNKKRNLDKNK